MGNRKDEFLERLLVTFRVEADEHLKSMAAGLQELEKVPDSQRREQIIEGIFRDAHSLKGAARAVNLADIESVCQSLESVFSALKAKKITATPPLLELLYQGVDILSDLLAPQSADSGKPKIAALIAKLGATLRDAASVAEPPPAPSGESTLSPVAPPPEPPVETLSAKSSPLEPDFASETIRVSTAKLDSVMRQTEELLTPRLAAAQRALELRAIGSAFLAWKKRRAKIQPSVRAAERSISGSGGVHESANGREAVNRLLEYMDAESTHLRDIEDALTRLRSSAERDHRALTGLVDSLLHDVKEMHMLPFASLTESFPRFIRQLARDQGKQAELLVEGARIEIDRRILEAMKAPLIHLLRNSMDHGIERPEPRVGKNKPPQGTIRITVAQIDGGKIEICVSDDGAGIDASQVLASVAREEKRSAQGGQVLNEEEALALIFRSGVSTSPLITDLSGRGLGLAIVWEQVERLGGAVTVETRLGVGTTFRIVLPLSLATFRGLLVRVDDQRMVIPARSVERVTQVPVESVHTVENRETIPVVGNVVPLVWLADVLEMPRREASKEAPDRVLAVVLGSESARVAFRVDEILGEQEVLVKNLGPQLVRVRNVVGACVLGTGQVVPVLNVTDLLKSAVQLDTTPRSSAAGDKPSQARKRSVLVVEDTFTSRVLLKNILETAGFHVTTAVDGVDAYATLKSGKFDLVVSDVEMPRMDGFDLTLKVRSDKQLAELPVVLVTALETREHRERGIDVGANAYIVKSSFEQSNLLEVIGRLI